MIYDDLSYERRWSCGSQVYLQFFHHTSFFGGFQTCNTHMDGRWALIHNFIDIHKLKEVILQLLGL